MEGLGLGAERGHGHAHDHADDDGQQHAQRRHVVNLRGRIAEQHLADQRSQRRGEHGEVDELAEGLLLDQGVDEGAQDEGQDGQQVDAVGAVAHGEHVGRDGAAAHHCAGQEHHQAADRAHQRRIQHCAGDAADFDEEVVLGQQRRLGEDAPQAAEHLAAIRRADRTDQKGNRKGRKHVAQNRAVALLTQLLNMHFNSSYPPAGAGSHRLSPHFWAHSAVSGRTKPTRRPKKRTGGSIFQLTGRPCGQQPPPRGR